MNFLAHLYLADPTPASMIGNLLPDLVRARHLPALNPAVAAGAARHQLVDRQTDGHPAHQRARLRLRADHGRFAPILADVMLDHCLAADWSRWHDQPLRTFVDEAYAAMLGRADLMPDAMVTIVQRMAAQDWLGSYATLEGIGVRLGQMARRFHSRWGRTFCPALAKATLQREKEGLDRDFDELFPALIEAARAGDAPRRPARLGLRTVA